MRKVMWRLPPLMALMFLINQLDRVNVSFAALTMNPDLGLSTVAYAWGAGIFFLAYFAFEVPSNPDPGAGRGAALDRPYHDHLGHHQRRHGAGDRPHQLPLIVRFLLGAAEAGFVPGLVLYITYWFPPGYRRARHGDLFLRRADGQCGGRDAVGAAADDEWSRGA